MEKQVFSTWDFMRKQGIKSRERLENHKHKALFLQSICLSQAEFDKRVEQQKQQLKRK